MPIAYTSKRKTPAVLADRWRLRARLPLVGDSAGRASVYFGLDIGSKACADLATSARISSGSGIRPLLGR